MSTLIPSFKSIQFHPVKRNNQIWLTSTELAQALGYAREDAVTKIYIRNLDEFTSNMTIAVENPKLGVSNLTSQTRVFTLRGAHLIAVFARTPIAKEFRKWVLDILDKEVQPLEPQKTKPKSILQNESVTAFLRECCEFGEWYSEPFSRIYDCYFAWAMRVEVPRGLSKDAFAKELALRGFVSGLEYREGQRARIRYGIRLKVDAVRSALLSMPVATYGTHRVLSSVALPEGEAKHRVLSDTEYVVDTSRRESIEGFTYAVSKSVLPVLLEVIAGRFKDLGRV